VGSTGQGEYVRSQPGRVEGRRRKEGREHFTQGLTSGRAWRGACPPQRRVITPLLGPREGASQLPAVSLLVAARGEGGAPATRQDIPKHQEVCRCLKCVGIDEPLFLLPDDFPGGLPLGRGCQPVRQPLADKGYRSGKYLAQWMGAALTSGSDEQPPLAAAGLAALPEELQHQLRVGAAVPVAFGDGSAPLSLPGSILPGDSLQCGAASWPAARRQGRGHGEAGDGLAPASPAQVASSPESQRPTRTG